MKNNCFRYTDLDIDVFLYLSIVVSGVSVIAWLVILTTSMSAYDQGSKRISSYNDDDDDERYEIDEL